MPILDGTPGYRLLRVIAPAEPSRMSGHAYAERSKIEALLGSSIWQQIPGKVVVDFGCGAGREAIELAQKGAHWVYGVDVSRKWLQMGREAAAAVNCRNITFCATPPEPADIIISMDAFEHFSDPLAILNTMAGLLRSNGSVLAAFGPTWYHPWGGHLFSVFPWAHLIFGESALCRWRSHIRADGAQRFCEVEGGLNQMTVRRFERLVDRSPFKLEHFEAVPIRRLRLFHNRLTREFLTAVVRCRLVLRGSDRTPS
jgi:SAM-dependent methyltransferase